MNNSKDKKPRWQYRFDSFKKVYKLLNEAIDIKEQRKLNSLETEGMIQRFEILTELSWKLLKDYLEYQSVDINQITPREIIKLAFSAKIIKNGQLWQKALDSRNKMSHTYDFAVFEDIVEKIHEEYFFIITDLYNFFDTLLKNEN